MFDFLGKKPGGQRQGKASAASTPASLLDVVVPFPEKPAVTNPSSGENSPKKSLLNQIDQIARDDAQAQAEVKAVQRAELRAKRAAFEQAEQQARIKADRAAAKHFEEKANWLAAEIERVRQGKARQAEPTDVRRTSSAGSVMPKSDPFVQQPAHQYRRPAEKAPANPQYASWPRHSVDDEQAQYEQFRKWQRLRPQSSPAQLDADAGSYFAATSEQDRGVNNGEQYSARQYSDRHREEPLYASQSPALDDQFHPAHRPDLPPEQQRIVPEAPNAAPEQPESGLYGQNYAAQPANSATVLDLDKLFSSIFRSWKLIGTMAVIGAVIGGIYAKSLPNTYMAWAELLIDPRDIKVIDSQLSPAGYSGETMIAYLESQLRIIESTSVLNAVIDSQNLLEDSEFNGKSSTGPGFFERLFPPSKTKQNASVRQQVLDNLQEKLAISRGSRTFIVAIGMRTEDAEKSARISNAIANAYVSGESGARSNVARSASEDLTDKLETLRNRVLKAEQRVANFKAENDLVVNEGKLTGEVQLSRLNEQLANARIELINAQIRMEQLKTIDLSNVLSGALPASLNTGTISQMRVRYAVLKSAADRLAVKLGPKHPERIAAIAELDSVKFEISREIRRLIAGSSKDYERAKNRQASLNQQLNTQKAAAAGTGSAMITLRELERELDANRRVYENYLLRSRQTSEQEGLTTTNARIITVAMPPLEKASPNRKVIAGVGMLAGAVAGLIFALFQGLFAGSLSGLIERRRPLGENRVHQNGAPIGHREANQFTNPHMGQSTGAPVYQPPQSPYYPPQPGAARFGQRGYPGTAK